VPELDTADRQLGDQIAGRRDPTCGDLAKEGVRRRAEDGRKGGSDDLLELRWTPCAAKLGVEVDANDVTVANRVDPIGADLQTTVGDDGRVARRRNGDRRCGGRRGHDLPR
jgi:hypothetical protein